MNIKICQFFEGRRENGDRERESGGRQMIFRNPGNKIPDILTSFPENSEYEKNDALKYQQSF